MVLKSRNQKKKKKKSSPHFLTFPPSIFNFPAFLFFLLHFPPFSLFPCLLFPGQKSRGGGALCPLPPPPPLPVTPLDVRPRQGAFSASQVYQWPLFVSPELSSERDYVITHSVCSMYVVFCKIDHCIHIQWCILMGLGHNDPWVESHMWPQQMWGQRSSRGNDL